MAGVNTLQNDQPVKTTYHVSSESNHGIRQYGSLQSLTLFRLEARFEDIYGISADPFRMLQTMASD